MNDGSDATADRWTIHESGIDQACIAEANSDLPIGVVTGACKRLYNIVQDTRLNHRIQVTMGELAHECSDQLRAFIRRKRGREAQS